MKNILAINSCRTRGIHKFLPDDKYTTVYVHTVKNPEYLHQHYTLLNMVKHDPSIQVCYAELPSTRQLIHTKLSKSTDITTYNKVDNNLHKYDLITIELNSIKCVQPISLNRFEIPGDEWVKLSEDMFKSYIRDIEAMFPEIPILWIGPLNMCLTEPQIAKITNNYQHGLEERRILNGRIKSRELSEKWLRSLSLNNIVYPSDIFQTSPGCNEPFRSEFDFAHLSNDSWLTLVEKIAQKIQKII